MYKKTEKSFYFTLPISQYNYMYWKFAIKFANRFKIVPAVIGKLCYRIKLVYSTFLKNVYSPYYVKIQLYVGTTRCNKNEGSRREFFFGFHQTTYFIFPYFVLYLMCKYLKDTKDIKQGRKWCHVHMHNYIILIVLHNIGKIKQDILQLHEHSKYEYNHDLKFHFT